MKNKYIAVQTKEKNLYSAYVLKVTTADNLISALKIKGILSANICNTRKEALELVNVWNQGFKDKGVLLYANAG